MTKVRVYKHDKCVYCPRLIGWLENKGIKYEIIDREEHPIIFKKMMDATGYMTVPVTQVEEDYIAGLNFGKLIPALRKNGLMQ